LGFQPQRLPQVQPQPLELPQPFPQPLPQLFVQPQGLQPQSLPQPLPQPQPTPKSRRMMMINQIPLFVPYMNRSPHLSISPYAAPMQPCCRQTRVWLPARAGNLCRTAAVLTGEYYIL